MSNLTDGLNFLFANNLPNTLSAEAATRAATDAANAAADAAHAASEAAARATAIAAEVTARQAAVAGEATARTASDTSMAQAVAAAQASATQASNTASAVRSDLAALKATGVLASPDTSLFPEFANDAAALAGGVTLGGIYRTGSILKVMVTTGTTPPVTPTRNPSFSTNIAAAVLGATTTVTVSGLLANESFTWSVVKDDPPTYTRRSSPLLTATANASGVVNLPAVFVETRDSLMLLFTNPVSEVHSTNVLTPAASQGGGGTASPVRGRPIISGGTVKTEIGTMMRGATMALDEIGSLASTYTKNRANWQLLRNQKLNLVRLPFSLSLVGVSLSAQLAEMDVAVDNAAATGMYIMPLFDWNYGTSNFTEMASAWPVICARYAARTHVLFEMQNEPHWNGAEFSSGELDSIASIYAAMRTAAPNSLIGVMTPASLQVSGGGGADTAGLITAAAGLVSRGCDIGTHGFVSYHVYGFYARSSVNALKAAYPCMLTETTSGGPGDHAVPHNEVYIIGEMETVGQSWIALPPRFGEVSNTDTPYSNDQATLTQRILPDLRAAGFDWVIDPLTTVTVPPVTGDPSIVSVTGNIAGATIGTPVTMTVTALNTNSVRWVESRSDWSWYGIDHALTLSLVSGSTYRGTFQWTPVAGGDRAVVWPTTLPGAALSSEYVPAPATGTGGGGPLPQPGSNTVRIDFANNNGGALDHTWGNTRALSYSGGIMRIAAIPGSPGDSGACGVMMGPWAANRGFGYGYYEWRVRFFGTGPGPCALLWAADDSWPRAEEDMGELDGGGNWYTAHHFEPTDGETIFQSYRAFYYRDAYPAKGDLPRGLWVTVGTLIRPGYLEYFVDRGQGVESIGSTTKNVTPMFSDGGVNRVPGVMHRGDLLDTAIEAQWFQFTPG